MPKSKRIYNKCIIRNVETSNEKQLEVILKLNGNINGKIAVSDIFLVVLVVLACSAKQTGIFIINL